MKIPGITISFFFFTVCASAQRTTIEEYIEQYKEVAISEMKRSGVPASITLAQGILESESGNGELVKKSNNHFGIKCKNTWAGDSVNHDDDAEGECFRAYENAADSYRDHSDFLRGNKRYESLFSLDITDYKGWAKGLKKAGYATNPRYPELLMKYIEQYNLQQYTLAAMEKLPELNATVNEKDKSVVEEQAANHAVSAISDDELGKILIINNSKCEVIKKGTSLLAIATKHNISLNRLMEFNDLTEEGILDRNQYIFLQKKNKAGDKEVYISKSGETVYDIAQKNGIQLRFLREYNNLGTEIAVPSNTSLYLKPGLRPMGVSNTSSKAKVHLVEPKEGLYSIARKYNVTVQQLREWNNLDSDNLKIGQEIIVSK